MAVFKLTIHCKFIVLCAFSFLFSSFINAASNINVSPKISEAVKGVTADSIIAQVDAHEKGFGSIYSDVELILTKKNGDKNNRLMKVEVLENTLEDPNDEDGILEYRRFSFLSPADIKGTSVLIHAKNLTLDNVWIYLPAFKRVKRISGGNRKAKFVGSEYFYEDLSPQKLTRYRNELLGYEKINNISLAKIKRTALFDKSSYKYNITYVTLATNRLNKIEYFDKKNRLLKTQEFHDYQLYLDKYLISNKQNMINHKTGHSSIMLWKNIKLQEGVSDTRFTQSSLKR